MTPAQVALIWLLMAAAVFAEPEKQKPQQPAAFLRPPSPSAESRSVVQRVARWFFSSGADEAGHHDDRGPPPSPPSSPHPAGSHGRHSSPKATYGPPRFKYGPPKPPTTHYGPPKPPTTHYGPPKPIPSHHEFPSGPPPAFFIKPSKRPDHEGSHHLRPPKPPVNQYGPPKLPTSSYGPPKPTSNYGPPTNAHGGPSVDSPAHYLSLKPPSISGPPLTPPSIHYGSPKPPGSNGQSSVFHGPLRPSRPPSPTYGSPGPLTHHKPSSSGYGQLRPPAFVPHPKPPKKDCNPCNRVPWVPMSVGGGSDLPPPSASSGGLYLPSPSSSYGPPPPLNIPDASAYNSGNDGHIDSATNGQGGHNVQGIHSSHTDSNGSPSSYGPPPIPPLLQIPNIQYGTPESIPSISTVGSIQQGPAYLPTAPSPQSHHQTAADTLNGNYRGPTQESQSLEVVKSVTLLSESYPPTINTPRQNNQGYQSPVHLIPGGNPNWPSPPTSHSAGTNAFNDQHTLESEFTQHTNAKGNDGSELEVIKSVPLADFVSSIEYPIEVVQSPSYVDVSPDTPINNGGNSLQPADQNVRENSEYLPPNEEIVIGKPVLKGEINIKQVTQSSSNEGYKNYNGDDSGNLSNTVNHQGEIDHSDQRQSGSVKQHINVNSVAKDQTEESDLKSEGNNFYLGTTHQSPQSFSLPHSHYSNENSFDAGNKNISFPQEVRGQTQDNQSGFGVGTQQHSASTVNVYNQEQSQTNGQPLTEQTSGPDFHQQTNVLLQPPHQQSGNNYYLVPHGPNISPSQKPPSVLQSSFAKPPEGQRVIVDIQPSVQTSAQGTSLIYQINNLKAPPPTAPLPNSFPNRPTQTAVFVSFQNGVQGAVPPQNLPAAVPPPGPGPVQDIYVRPPNSFRNPLIAFQSLYKPDIPAQFLNPPGINPPPIWSQSLQDYSSAWTNAGAPPPFKYLPDSSAVASFSSPGLYPPPPVPPPAQEPIHQTPQQGHKRPKKIQVIVPYTSTKNLVQFPSAGSQNTADANAGPWTPIPETDKGVAISDQQPTPHVNCTDPQKPWHGYIFCYPSQFYISQPSDTSHDHQQHQESRAVTQKATLHQNLPQLKNHQPVTNTGEVQHIFASNIRELLRGEEEVKNVTEDTLLRLQKNIDEWTALAYSKHNRAEERKTTTPKPPVSALRHRLVSSKQIPEEYLTTTPLPYDDINQNTESFAPTAVPALRLTTAASSPPISSRFFDHEAAGSHSHAVTANAYDKPTQKKNGLSGSVDHKWKFFENNLVLPEAVTVVTTTVSSTAGTVTPVGEQITTEPEEERQGTETGTEVPTTSLTTTQAPWTKLQVSISPITKERVYVVTPLSSWEQQQLEATTTSPTAERRYTPTESYREGKSHDLDFHSPRFIVRPTPASTLPLQTLFAPADGDARADDRSGSVHVDGNSTASAGNTLFDEFVSLFNIEEELSNSTTPSPPTSSAPAIPTPASTPMAMRSRAGAVFLRLLDAPTYSPPDAAAIHTITGHSKVSTAATSATPGGQKSRDSFLRHFPDPVLEGKAQQDLAITAADHARSQRPSSS